MIKKIQYLKDASEEVLSSLQNNHLLVDTNFFIDAKNNKTIFLELIKRIKGLECTIVSIDAVLYEFIKGSKSFEEYKTKLDFYKTIVDATIQTHKTTHENVLSLTRLLLKRSQQLSYTDILLLSTLMTYGDSIYLLSKDRSDIVTTVFPIVLSIVIETDINNCTFSIYKFDKKSYLQELEGIIGKIPF